MAGIRVLIWHFKFSMMAALLYLFALVFFIQAEDFGATWILYVGNFMFGLGILVHTVMYKPAVNIKNKFPRKILAGHLVSVAGILSSCILILVLFQILLPEIFHSATEGNEALNNRPAQMMNKTQGLLFVVYLNNIVGNISAGSFISILFSFVLSDRNPRT